MEYFRLKKLVIIVALAIYLLNTCVGKAHGAAELKDLIVGKRFSYLISWNGISVGTVSTKVEGLTEVHGRKAYKVSLRAKTNRWASLIYNVDDRFITYIDYETSNSLRHEITRSEGRYRKRAIIEYIYDKFLAEYRYLKDNRRKTINVQQNIQDPLSAAYYFLRIDFKEGDRIALNIDLNEKSYRLYANVEKGRLVRIPRLGKFNTLIIRPYVERKGKPFRRGSGFAYIALGKEKLPIFCVVNVFIWGRFSATLLPQVPQ